jgi:phenylacetate-CoA ligase
VERAEGAEPGREDELAREISAEIKKHILVSARAEVVDYGSLPRSERKSKRVFDYRETSE